MGGIKWEYGGSMVGVSWEYRGSKVSDQCSVISVQ